MKINILRSEDNTYQTYTLLESDITLLDALIYIKKSQDATLTFTAGCRSSVCGTCAVRINGKEQLSCGYKVRDGDTIEPLQYHQVLRDLKISKQKSKATLSKSNAWLQEYKEVKLTYKDEKLTEIQTDCILCDSCYSACPVYAVNPNFIGPFSLTRVYRYSLDRREKNIKKSIDKIQSNGIWDCTLCGECTAVCPKGIDPKMDIIMLRNTSIQMGYDDPSFALQSFGMPDFNDGGFGFDPNSSF